MALVIAVLGLSTALVQAGGHDSKPTVLVAGATGGTGQQIVKHLLGNGFAVRAMVRNEEKARKLWSDDVSYVVADVRQPDQIITAMTGADYVIVSIAATRGKPANSPEFVDFGGVRNLADVAAALKVKQLVLVSSSGVTDPDHFLNKMFDNVLGWKLKGENALRGSGVPYTIVRPGGLVNEPGGEARVVFAQGDTTSGTITREDVGVICVAALRSPDAINKTFETHLEPGEAIVDWNPMFAVLKAD